jgi:hypothetical protein
LNSFASLEIIPGSPLEKKTKLSGYPQTLASTFYLFLQQKSEVKMNIYLLKKVALTKTFHNH